MLFSSMFPSSKTLAIVAAKHGWDLDEKARACKNAALVYLVLAIVFFAGSPLLAAFKKTAVGRRFFRWCWQSGRKARDGFCPGIPLRRKGRDSDDSGSELDSSEFRPILPS